MNDKLNAIKAKIRALAAKTIDNGCTEAEVNSAMALIGKLLSSYNLSMDEVDLRSETFVPIRIESGRSQITPVGKCLVQIGKFCDCKVWMTKDHINRPEEGIVYFIFGAQSDALMAEYLYNLINTSIFYELGKFHKSSLYASNIKSGRTLTFNFYAGITSRINVRLRSMKDDMVKEADAVRTGKSLVLVKNSILENEFKNLSMKLKETKSSKLKNTDMNAFLAGTASANNINLSRPVGTDGKPSMTYLLE
jgi:hypothetical protein